MRGTKRFAVSDSNPIFNPNDSFMQSKRVIMGSPFDAQRSETSIQPKQLPPLDIQRAESSRQHVRALNTQFASWVQAQLQDHPDELWEDGVQDYLNHAKNVVEKFSDVVNWLKANAGKGESLSELGSNDAQKKPSFEIESKDNNNKLLLDKPMFPPAATTTNFGSSWSSGLLFSNNKPFTFGGSQVSVPENQNSVLPDHDASNDGDAEEDAEQPNSPSVKKSEEKGINVVHEVKCKLYVKSSDPADKDAWKDKGTGQLCIKCKEGVSKGTRESKPTIVIRNDVGRVLLNALLYPGIKTNMQKNAVVAIFHTSDGDSNNEVAARTFLMRTKTEDDRNKLAAIIQEYAPSA
ncbi:uncharacterized protein LOC111371790 [Olea europaea var. sylvestris]|uniref:uncharacterized protein LOC111371790 n=1 Tax=Olea europaea var. sylvestris TaxID=158386 RepID=UPI000C1CEDEB|nr:uncharacterized protein LOC111371790 [Olea europaea var. sylvestris]